MISEYFMDVYGYLYRWEATPEGKKSVVVANWQGDNKGSAKEVSTLIERLRAAEDECNKLAHQINELRSALQQCSYDYAHHSFATSTADAINNALNGN